MEIRKILKFVFRHHQKPKRSSLTKLFYVCFESSQTAIFTESFKLKFLAKQPHLRILKEVLCASWRWKRSPFSDLRKTALFYPRDADFFTSEGFPTLFLGAHREIYGKNFSKISHYFSFFPDISHFFHEFFAFLGTACTSRKRVGNPSFTSGF